MARYFSVDRFLLSVAVIGTLAGASVGIGVRSAQAAEGGGGNWICTSNSSCGAGAYHCSVLCSGDRCSCDTY